MKKRGFMAGRFLLTVSVVPIVERNDLLWARHDCRVVADVESDVCSMFGVNGFLNLTQPTGV